MFEQQGHKIVCTITMNAFQDISDLLERIITVDESWFSTYDSEKNRYYNSPTSLS